MNITLFVEMAPYMYEGDCKLAYPEGLDKYLEAVYKNAGHSVRTVIQKEGGDASEVLEALPGTDVLVWWSHSYHHLVADAVAAAVATKVLGGMGLCVLHSSHMSKPFLRLLGTDGTLSWREINENERLWIIDPSHPIAAGLPECIEIPHEEMYGEPFGIPAPDELVMIGWYKGGEVFRSGAVFKRGRGKIFYFQPGHETNETYRDPNIQKVLLNAVDYLKCPSGVLKEPRACAHTPNPYEKVD